MKSMILRLFTMLVLAFALGAVAVQAQSASQMKADIPFRFVIGDQTLPAGEYTIRYVNQDSGKTALLFKSTDGRTSRIVNMMTAEKGTPRERAGIVFNQYGDQYFLSEVWTAGDQYGLTLPKSRAEKRQLKGDIAANNQKRVSVALITRR